MMTGPINFQDGKFDSYSLTLEEGLVKVDCYLLGSITGGTGTECGHTIQGIKIAEFLEAMGSPTIADLREKALHYQSTEWRKIHEVIQKFQTDTWSWSETNWDD
jgi:hypothetical protein